MNLFNFSPPAEDEFSLTYLLRIAQMNGISNLNHFFNNVVFDTPCSICSTKDISYSGSYTGMEFPVNKLIQCLPTGDVAQLDSSRFLMEHTLFPLFSPFFASDSQKRNSSMNIARTPAISARSNSLNAIEKVFTYALPA